MIAIIIGVIVTILDQITKIIVQNVKPTGSKNPGFIDFRLTYNQGAAFSFMDNNTLFLAILSLVASALIIYIILKYIPFKTKKLLHISMGLILGGCVGNLIDRFMTVFKWRKGVIDFIDVPKLPYSSTDIRKKVAMGLSVKEDVGEEVEEYIKSRKLYV